MPVLWPRILSLAFQTVVDMALANTPKHSPQDHKSCTKDHKRSMKKVRFEPGSARFKDFQPCSNLEPDLWSGSTHPPEPWTELRSGSEKFRFELWFGTELRHPYSK